MVTPPKKLWWDTNRVQWRSRRRFGSLHFRSILSDTSTALPFSMLGTVLQHTLMFQSIIALDCEDWEKKVSGTLVGYESPSHPDTPYILTNMIFFCIKAGID